MANPGVIFISYRRSHDGGYAWALRDYLRSRFNPDTLFFDRENIDAGTVFPDRLGAAVEGCQVLLAVIGPGWLEATDGNGHRRLDDEDDWVRREIALALALGKTVIPVLFGDDTQPPPADRLPAPLQPLARLQAKHLRGDFSEYDAQRQDLVRLLAQVPGVPAPRADASQPVIGIPPEQVASLIAAASEPLAKLTAQQQETIRELERQTGVSEGALRTFFRTLGEQDVPPERYAEKLGEIAERYRTLLAEIATMPAEEPEIARLKESAGAALQAGDLDKASALHVEMLALQDQAADRAWHEAERKRLDAAATAARLGEIALTGLRYLEAAKHFAAAASRVPPGYEDDCLHYLDAEVDALYRQGEEKGDNATLRTAIERFELILSRRPRDRVPLQWATTQTNLGNALQTLGERESGTARLEDAVAAYRATLAEFTRDRVPLDWAGIQNNLGLALWRLGEREKGTARLEDAVAAYRATLEEYTRERVPLQWATAQNNLGNALQTLGARDSSTARLEEAVAAYRLALEERARDRVPLDWAMTQNNLGLALWRLGERESGTARLEEAVTAYRAALEEYTRERVPLQWATTQNNLGNALSTLGERESGTARLEDAVAAYRAALEERTRDRVPLQWAMTQTNLGNALSTLGERTDDLVILRDARASVSAAFEVIMQSGQEQYRGYFEERLRQLDDEIAALAKPQ